jgi:N-acetylglutamate synthase-like GNAT family acetyltransferase
VIRPAEPRDFDIIHEIINDAATAYKGQIPDDCWHEPYMSRDQLQREIAHGVTFWLYEQDGTVVGVMGIQKVRDVVLVRHAYVRTAARNHGIGAQLLAHLQSLAEAPILIGTWADARWAIGFYEKHGFQLVDAQTKDQLLARYWTISQRQLETSVVLADATWYARNHSAE